MGNRSPASNKRPTETRPYYDEGDITERALIKALEQTAPAEQFSPDQPRDDQGQFAPAGGGGDASGGPGGSGQELAVPTSDHRPVDGAVTGVERESGGIYTYHVRTAQGESRFILSAAEHNSVLRHFGLTAETSLTGPVGLRVTHGGKRDRAYRFTRTP